MRITIEALRERAGDCPEWQEALSAFEANFPDGLEWTPQGQIAALRSPLRQWLGKWWAMKLIPRWDMTDVDLSAAVLSAADLAHTVLAGASLSNAILTSADLTSACLGGTDLSGANLAGAVLLHADLAGANLAGANLAGAVLLRADLAGADLRGADLAGADLRGAIANAETVWPDGFDYKAAGVTMIEKGD